MGRSANLSSNTPGTGGRWAWTNSPKSRFLGDNDPIAFISQLNPPPVGFAAMDFGKPDVVVPVSSQPLDDGTVDVFIGDQLQGDVSLRNKVSSKPIVSAANR